MHSQNIHLQSTLPRRYSSDTFEKEIYRSSKNRNSLTASTSKLKADDHEKSRKSQTEQKWERSARN